MLTNEKKYEKLLQKFISGAECTVNVDNIDKTSVKKNNKGVDQYRQAAKQICERFPNQRDNFANLLNYPVNEVRVACAVCMIELMDYDEKWRNQALEVIKADYPSKPRFEKSMVNIWLKNHGFEEIEKIY